MFKLLFYDYLSPSKQLKLTKRQAHIRGGNWMVFIHLRVWHLLTLLNQLFTWGSRSEAITIFVIQAAAHIIRNCLNSDKLNHV